MQTLGEVDAQTTCKQLLDLDEEILFSGCLDGLGVMVGEAMKDSISAHARLTVMVLPLHHNDRALVLATAVDSDINSIVQKTKRFFAKSSEPQVLSP
jgi:hypothetical protein